MFNRILTINKNKKKLIMHNYHTNDNKEINIYFSNMILRHIDLTKLTLEHLEFLRDKKLLSKDCLFQGCKFSFEVLSNILNDGIQFFGKSSYSLLDCLNFKHLEFKELKNT